MSNQMPDKEFKLAEITYPKEYSRLIAEFNSLTDASLNGLKVMQDILQDYNPAHYTVWKRRWEFIISLNYNLQAELEWITSLLFENPKTYQIWNYRQKIINLTLDPTDELLTVAEILKDDSKNYHAWAYRQWIIKKFELFDGELEYTSLLLQQDVYNNSAWNQRYFLLSLGKISIKKELDYVKDKISLYPDNESSWNYYRGILNFSKLDPDTNDESFVKSYSDSIFALYTLLLWSKGEEKRIILGKLAEKDDSRFQFWTNYPI